MKNLKKKNRNRIFVFCLFLFLGSGINLFAQVAKLFTTNEDLVQGNYEHVEGITLTSYSEEIQKIKFFGAFAFTSEDNVLQRRIAKKVLWVEYGDSLYLNVRMLKDFNANGKFAAAGFVKVRKHQENVYFEAMQKVKANIAPALMFGLVGASIAEDTRRKKAKATPLLYYCYNPDSNYVGYMRRSQLVEILKEGDPDLYAHYELEPLPEDVEVISFYARIFFEKIPYK